MQEGIKLNVNIKKEDYILVVSPHADDESIGCGGLLSLYGTQCDLMLLTDGRKGHTTEEYSDEALLIQTRTNEFNNVANLAGVKNVLFVNIEDGTVNKHRKQVYKYDITHYDYIFVPNRYESHLDHQSVVPIFKKMKKKQQAKAMIFEYEVWTPLRHVTWFLDITSVAENKSKMIGQHASQLADIDYVKKGMALSCYRGMFNDTEYSEAFLYSDFSGIKRWIYGLLSKGLKEKIKKVVFR